MLLVNEIAATVDFETRSACNLKAIGAWKYSLHPSTEIMCMVYQLPYWPDGITALWTPAYPRLGIAENFDADTLLELLDWIEAGELIEAHNVSFEIAIWSNILTPKHGFPLPAAHTWRCSAAKAAAHALPRALDQANPALHLDVLKDDEGHKLMMKLSKPRKPRKKERELWEAAGKNLADMPLLWWEDLPSFQRLWQYCTQDVLAEGALSAALDPLNPDETQNFLLDQTINQRGFRLDLEAVEIALSLISSEMLLLNSELAALTGGLVQRATQRERMKKWLATEGLTLFDTKGATIDELLNADDEVQSAGPDELPPWVAAVSPAARRALEILRTLGRSSTAKYETMLDWACPDGRVRGGLLYHGASTGRWCLTGDHEVLTPTGWVRLDRWPGGDIAVWNPSEEISFQKSKALTFPFSGDLVHHVSQRIDQLSTPEHSMPYWNVKTGVFGARQANASGRIAIPYTGTRLSRPATDAALLRILVMTQADGHYAEDGSLRFHFKKVRKTERCLRLLRQAGILYTHRPPNGDGTTTISVSLRHQPLAIRMFQDKVFGWWLLDEDATVVFDELEYWDAYRSGPNSLQYSSVIRQNVDVLQALAHTSGRATSITQKAERNANWKTSHVLSVWLTPSNRHELRQRPTMELFNGFVHCAETSTGFFLVRRNGKVWVTGNSGKGVQPHNFPKGTIPGFEMEVAWDLIKTGDREVIQSYVWEHRDKDGKLLSARMATVMEVLACALRGAIVPSKGHELFVADYSGIEVRVLWWAADDKVGLKLLATGADPYCSLASDICGRPITKADKERQLGKAGILGCGYGMGWAKFVGTAKDMFGLVVTDEESENVVNTYRQKFHRVKSFWYETEEAACWAVQHPGKVAKNGYCSWQRVIDKTRGTDFLFCTLPSGRRLAYCDPELRERETPWGAVKLALTFMGMDAYSKKWKRQSTYGGSLVENLVQAISRDIMAEAMQRCEAGGVYVPILSIHDEIISEVKLGKGNVREYEDILTQEPTWARGCPIGAEGFSALRYKK